MKSYIPNKNNIYARHTNVRTKIIIQKKNIEGLFSVNGNILMPAITIFFCPV